MQAPVAANNTTRLRSRHQPADKREHNDVVLGGGGGNFTIRPANQGRRPPAAVCWGLCEEESEGFCGGFGEVGFVEKFCWEG